MILKLFWLIVRKSERFIYLVILKKFIGLDVIENFGYPRNTEIGMRAWHIYEGSLYKQEPRFEIMTLKKYVGIEVKKVILEEQMDAFEEAEKKRKETLNFPAVDFVAMKRELQKKEGKKDPIIKKQKIEKKEEYKSYEEREAEAYDRVPD